MDRAEKIDLRISAASAFGRGLANTARQSAEVIVRKSVLAPAAVVSTQGAEPDPLRSDFPAWGGCEPRQISGWISRRVPRESSFDFMGLFFEAGQRNFAENDSDKDYCDPVTGAHLDFEFASASSKTLPAVF